MLTVEVVVVAIDDVSVVVVVVVEVVVVVGIVIQGVKKEFENHYQNFANFSVHLVVVVVGAIVVGLAMQKEFLTCCPYSFSKYAE